VFDNQSNFAGRRGFLRTLGGGLVLGVAASPLAYAALDDSLAQQQVILIDLAIKQRLLIQRCAKLYAQTLLGARASDAKRLISDSIASFEAINNKQNADAGKSGSTTYRNLKVLDDISQEWPKLRALLPKSPTERALPDTIAQSETLSKLINQSTGPSDQYLSRSPIGQLVAISGKQSFITQRMATYYFLRTLKFNPEDANRTIGDLVGDFEYNSGKLTKSQGNTAEITMLLQLAGTQWPYFKEAINTKVRADGAQLDYNVATAAENMLEVLQRTNSLYYKLATN